MNVAESTLHALAREVRHQELAPRAAAPAQRPQRVRRGAPQRRQRAPARACGCMRLASAVISAGVGGGRLAARLAKERIARQRAPQRLARARERRAAARRAALAFAREQRLGGQRSSARDFTESMLAPPRFSCHGIHSMRWTRSSAVIARLAHPGQRVALEPGARVRRVRRRAGVRAPPSAVREGAARGRRETRSRGGRLTRSRRHSGGEERVAKRRMAAHTLPHRGAAAGGRPGAPLSDRRQVHARVHGRADARRRISGTIATRSERRVVDVAPERRRTR